MVEGGRQLPPGLGEYVCAMVIIREADAQSLNKWTEVWMVDEDLMELGAPLDDVRPKVYMAKEVFLAKRQEAGTRKRERP